MSAPYCMTCGADDAIYERGLDNFCACCAEDFDAAIMGEIFEALGDIINLELETV